MVVTYTEQMISLNGFNFSTTCSSVNKISRVNLGSGLWGRRKRNHKRCCQPRAMARKSLFQDFQNFVKPASLLPAEEPKIHSQNVPKESFYPSKLDQSKSWYIFQLSTSRDFGSGLSDQNAGIMVCLLDSEGNSILQRIPSIPYLEQEEADLVEREPFQRGSVDTVAFEGAKLGNIVALWLGLDSGSWKLDGVQLTVVDSLSKDEEQSENKQFNGFQYKFDATAISLGEKSVSMVELRPVLTMQLQGEDLSSLPASSVMPNLKPYKESKEQSMKEYADLKLSLIIYDLALVLTGFGVLSLSSYEKEAYLFLFGGFCGFLYLILLQKSVDAIPGPELYPESGKVQNSVRRPLLVLAFVIAASAVLVKYRSGEANFVLTPAELFAGAAGFWANKIAVLLSAFKPLKRESE